MKVSLLFLETKAAGLSVLSIDMRVTENKKDHNTDKYKCSTLIVRRNKEFTIIIKLDRAFNAEQDDMQIEFLIGEPLHLAINCNT